jgi:hypothetical protein
VLDNQRLWLPISGGVQGTDTRKSGAIIPTIAKPQIPVIGPTISLLMRQKERNMNITYCNIDKGDWRPYFGDLYATVQSGDRADIRPISQALSA